MRDGPLDGGADLAEIGAGGGLRVVQLPAGRGPVRDQADALDPDVARVGGGVHARQHALEARGLAGVGVVAGAGTGTGPTAASSPAKAAAIWTFMPG